MSNLIITRYSDKAIAVFGNTENYKTQLIDLGGKYNPRLKKEGEITPGWIFPKLKQSQLQELINSGFQTHVRSQNHVVDVERFTTISNLQLSNIMSRLDTLERLLKISQHSHIIEDEEIEKPHIRLLR